MRMIKTPEEIEKIQKAITLTNTIYENILPQVQS